MAGLRPGAHQVAGGQGGGWPAPQGPRVEGGQGGWPAPWGPSGRRWTGLQLACSLGGQGGGWPAPWGPADSVWTGRRLACSLGGRGGGWPAPWVDGAAAGLPRGRLRAFILVPQLQNIASHPHLLTVHDFEQEGSEELDTVILKALVKGEARPPARGGPWGGPASPARGDPHALPLPRSSWGLCLGQGRCPGAASGPDAWTAALLRARASVCVGACGRAGTAWAAELEQSRAWQGLRARATSEPRNILCLAHFMRCICSQFQTRGSSRCGAAG